MVALKMIDDPPIWFKAATTLEKRPPAPTHKPEAELGFSH